MNKNKKHRRCQGWHKGSGLLSVISTIAFIMLLASSLLYLSYVALQIKYNEIKNEKDFYIAEEVLNAELAIFYKNTVIALENSYGISNENELVDSVILELSSYYSESEITSNNGKIILKDFTSGNLSVDFVAEIPNIISTDEFQLDNQKLNEFSVNNISPTLFFDENSLPVTLIIPTNYYDYTEIFNLTEEYQDLKFIIALGNLSVETDFFGKLVVKGDLIVSEDIILIDDFYEMERIMQSESASGDRFSDFFIEKESGDNENSRFVYYENFKKI